MQPRPYILAETTWKQVQRTKFEVAVLPWGATEAHNFHMPYATDNYQCDFVAAESARVAWEAGAKVMVLPTVPFGVQTGQLDIAFDINMNPSTQQMVLRDIVASLSGQGIKKLVILNGHGGNEFRQIIRELQGQFPDMLLCQIHWTKVVNQKQFFDEPGDHADEMETSAILHIAPHLVRPLSEAGNGKTNAFRIAGLREGWAWAQREWTKATNDTGSGNPAKASAEKGRAYLDATAQKIGGFLTDLAQADLQNLYQR